MSNTMTDETISLLQRAAVAAVNELRRLIEAIHELREDRDHWRLRAERAEYALPSTPGALVIETPYQCRVCGGTGRNPMSDNANWLPCAACSEVRHAAE